MKCFSKPFIVAILAASTRISAFALGNQHRLGLDIVLGTGNAEHHPSRPRCYQPRPIDPSGDGLRSSKDLFSGSKMLDLMVDRHKALVQIPSICYDDLGGVDDDDRWEPFSKIPGVLEEKYPTVHKYIVPEKINKYGLVYTVHGADDDLKPILLTAHQDVVPVESETLDDWEHPPFGGYYNETDGYLWGRGASDDKSAITALMSALESLLSQEEYKPRRTVIFAFGFDEECSGTRGAGEISKYLEEQYGEDGIAVILDEGGAGLQNLGGTLYALPAVYEKGYLDVWFNLSVVGGHSSVPTPHTAIGIMSEVITTLEHNPFRPEIERNGPVHQALTCLAQYSPHALPELTRLVRWGNLDGAAHLLAGLSRDTQYTIQTSQSVNIINGGQKINALPEFVTVGVNHRFAPQDTIGDIQHRIVHLVENIARKYDLRFEPFEDDEDYKEYLMTNGLSHQCDKARNLWKPIYNGTLSVEVKKKSCITPKSPTSGPVWNTLAGTIRYTYADEASTVVAAPGAMTGNTDARHYLNLSKNIYRWSPGSLKSFSNIHTVNERLLMSEHVNMVKFYYDFIRNFDQAKI
ncbi:hypothetical protein NW762_010795 [Fusarium torreyae]|uniref:Peptidase M20 dimerisation domain-containing protein n=1 Tax=Fusarium torreyae TaxID=1237075 RepID=A0A9W8VD21_9HYPO|nr:hypothetical protein NW762_010795 [Fusarium torreyae]